MKLAVIYINYRTAQMTMDSVRHLLGELPQAESFHVYIVDNDSRDGSCEAMAQVIEAEGLQDRVSVIASPFNGGYGYGINHGVKLILGEGKLPTYFYVINTDATPDPSSLARLLSFMDEHPSVGIAGSSIVDTDGAVQGAAFRFPSIYSEFEDGARFNVVSKLLNRHIMPMPPPSNDCAVDWVPGTSLLIRREVFERGVWFDEDFFLYFEEIDFARQVWKAGWEVYFVADAPVTHLGSVSTGLCDGAKAWPAYWYDSRRRYFMKYHGSGYALACDAARVAGQAVHFIKCAVKREPYSHRPGTLHGLVGAALRGKRGGSSSV